MNQGVARGAIRDFEKHIVIIDLARNGPHGKAVKRMVRNELTAEFRFERLTFTHGLPLGGPLHAWAYGSRLSGIGAAAGIRRSRGLGATLSLGLVMVKVEDVSVQILYCELPQSPGLLFQRIDDLGAPRLQLRVRLVDVLREDPVNRRFEWRFPLPQENRYILA